MRKGWKRHLLVGASLAALSVAVCLTFYFTRLPDEAFFQRWEAAEQGGAFYLSDADPFHFAERPVSKGGFHGSDVWWVEWHLSLSFPSLLVAWVGTHLAFPNRFMASLGAARFLRLESWFLGVSYLLLSTGQWFLVGLGLSLAGRRLRRRKQEAA